MFKEDLCLRKTLTIILYRGPYASQRVDVGLAIAEKALERGYGVNIFLYMDAVHAPKKGQMPRYFPNVGEKLRALAEKGARIRACSRCAAARGYVEEDAKDGVYPTSQYVDGVAIVNLRELGDWIKLSDKVIVI
ncbi:MAG: DsrE family protein [Candidatus Freyarchaeota archaeon]|nr:DsrE family protein [Candidatus Jordarchaeia archaeon]